jgi:hypothetical protein
MSLCVTAVSDPAGLGIGLAISLTWHGPTVRTADLAMSLCVTAVSDPAALAAGLAISLLSLDVLPAKSVVGLFCP